MRVRRGGRGRCEVPCEVPAASEGVQRTRLEGYLVRSRARGRARGRARARARVGVGARVRVGARGRVRVRVRAPLEGFTASKPSARIRSSRGLGAA